MLMQLYLLRSLKGNFSVTNPNFNNSDKSVFVSIKAEETDKLKDFGYKTNKTGFSLGTNFEYLKDFNLGLSTSSFLEKMETDSTASASQQKQAGNYLDTFLKFNFDYDKRNQKFKTTDGFRSYYSIDLPLISDTNTLTNSYDYKVFNEFYEK
jgi:outer membrane protein insertion porin family